MVRRRQVLIGGGIGVAAMGSALGAGRATTAGNRPVLHGVSLFLVDRSIDGATDIASRADIPLIQYKDDIGVPWLEHLEPAWRQNPQPVIGVTLAGAFFCLEQLARPYGLISSFRFFLPMSRHSGSVNSFTSERRSESSLTASQKDRIDALFYSATRRHKDTAAKVEGAADMPLMWMLQPRDARRMSA